MSKSAQGLQWMQGQYVLTAKNTKVAFVSTNSICQGESVAAMWKPLIDMGVEIDFVWRTFRWDNEAQAKAHVHCVIIGFGVRGDKLTQSSQSPQSGGIETSRTSRELITQTAQAILDARELYPDSSLADLYDPLTMPPELRKAHAANDAAVIKAYGLVPDISEPEIVAHLFKLYANKVNVDK